MSHTNTFLVEIDGRALPGAGQPGAPRVRNVVLNALAARSLGFPDPSKAIGKRLLAEDEFLMIIGVVEDSRFRSVRDYLQGSLELPVTGESFDDLSQVAAIGPGTAAALRERGLHERPSARATAPDRQPARARP